MPKSNPTSLELQRAVLKTLRYFAFFRHPLTLEELHTYLCLPATLEEVESEVQRLVAAKVLVREHGYVATDAAFIDKRSQHQALNEKRLQQAQWIGRQIGRFPFVRGVYVSGSLSKLGITGPSDDIDYFIITQPGRVWTAKFWLIAFKKIFLLNSNKFFCINFLMDLEHLKLARQNRYIGTEAVSLIPLVRPELRDYMLRENQWLQELFPNIVLGEPQRSFRPLPLRWHERLLNALGGDAFERWAAGRFRQHVAQQQHAANSHYDTSAHVSAYFPESIEHEVLTYYDNYED